MKRIEPVEVKHGWQISEFYISNCFIEAIKHWILHPLTTRIGHVSPRINVARCPHFFWVRNGEYFDFTIADENKPNELLFRGYIRKINKGEKI